MKLLLSTNFLKKKSFCEILCLRKGGWFRASSADVMSVYRPVFLGGMCDSARHRGFYIRCSFPLSDISFSAVIKYILNFTLPVFIVSLKKMYVFIFDVPNVTTLYYLSI